MKKRVRSREFPVLPFAALLFAVSSACCYAQASTPSSQSVLMPQYTVTIGPSDQPGDPPQVRLERGHQTIFQMPVVAGLASPSSEEHLSDITYSMRKSGADAFELNVTAESSLW